MTLAAHFSWSQCWVRARKTSSNSARAEPADHTDHWKPQKVKKNWQQLQVLLIVVVANFQEQQLRTKPPSIPPKMPMEWRVEFLKLVRWYFLKTFQLAAAGSLSSVIINLKSAYGGQRKYLMLLPKLAQQARKNEFQKNLERMFPRRHRRLHRLQAPHFERTGIASCNSDSDNAFMATLLCKNSMYMV